LNNGPLRVKRSGFLCAQYERKVGYISPVSNNLLTLGNSDAKIIVALVQREKAYWKEEFDEP